MERCDQDVFTLGHSICVLDACRHRAETFAQAVAADSGQRADWHYSGGRANVLYLGDHAKVAAAVERIAPTLTVPMHHEPNECGSCDGDAHRPATMLQTYGDGEHGIYRAGDPLPDGVLAVDTSP